MKLWKVYYELERQNIIKSIDLAKKRWRRFAETVVDVKEMEVW